MTVVSDLRPLTQEEFMRLQRDGAGYEYEHGRLIELAPVDAEQGGAWTDVVVELGHHVKQCRCGQVWLDTLTYLDEAGTVRYFPDIVYLANDVLHRCVGKRIVGPPTLVVEVTTPDSDEREEGTKKANYHRFGVPWYWVVNTVRGVTEEYRHGEDGYRLVSDTSFTETFRPALFPGLEIVLEPRSPVP